MSTLKITPEQSKYIFDNYKKLSAIKMAQVLGVPNSRVYRYLLEKGWERVDRKVLKEMRARVWSYEKDIMELRGKLPSREIAQKFGLKLSDVNRVIYTGSQNEETGYFNVSARPEGWLV